MIKLFSYRIVGSIRVVAPLVALFQLKREGAPRTRWKEGSPIVGDGTHDLSTPFQRGRQLARLSTVLALLRPPRHGQRAGQAPGRVSLSLQLSHTDRNRGASEVARPRRASRVPLLSSPLRGPNRSCSATHERPVPSVHMAEPRTLPTGFV